MDDSSLLISDLNKHFDENTIIPMKSNDKLIHKSILFCVLQHTTTQVGSRKLKVNQIRNL